MLVEELPEAFHSSSNICRTRLDPSSPISHRPTNPADRIQLDLARLGYFNSIGRAFFHDRLGSSSLPQFFPARLMLVFSHFRLLPLALDRRCSRRWRAAAHPLTCFAGPFPCLASLGWKGMAQLPCCCVGLAHLSRRVRGESSWGYIFRAPANRHRTGRLAK